jgi:hypothetical protein
MRRDPHRVLRYEQPINWGRAFWVGMLAFMFMMFFVDCFDMMGISNFSFETYLGKLFYGETYKDRAWLVGFLLNLGMGGMFGMLYGYFFEYSFYRANARNGILVGLIHTAVAAIAVFPFFNIIHEFLGHERYAGFGILGSGQSPATPVVITLGHLLYGATLGTLYGPVRQARLRARDSEPGEFGQPGEPDVITRRDDADDGLVAV